MAVKAVQALVERHQEIEKEKLKGKSPEETFEQRLKVLRQLKEEEENIEKQLQEIWKMCESVLKKSEKFSSTINRNHGRCFSYSGLDDYECYD